jgi:hypothetical protein
MQKIIGIKPSPLSESVNLTAFSSLENALPEWHTHTGADGAGADGGAIIETLFFCPHRSLQKKERPDIT